MKKAQAQLRSGNRISYSIEEKRQICLYAFRNSQMKAAVKFGVHKSMVSRWMKDFEKFQLADPSAKRISSKIAKRRPIKGDTKKETYQNHDMTENNSAFDDQDQPWESFDQIMNEETVPDDSTICAPLISSSSNDFLAKKHFDTELFCTPINDRTVFLSQDESAGSDLMLCSSGSTYFNPITKTLSKDEEKKKSKIQMKVKRAGQKKRTYREGYHLDQSLSVDSYSIFPSESSPRDKQGLSILLQVPEVANVSFSNLVNAAMVLSANEQDHIAKCFEGLSILAKASTKRFRYISVPASDQK